MSTAIQLHQKLKLNHVVNLKSVNQVHGANGLNAMPNVINSGELLRMFRILILLLNSVKCSVIVNVIAPKVFPKKMKNAVAIHLNAKPARVHHVHALVIGQNGLHAMASVVAVNAPANETIHVFLILFPKSKKKCVKKNVSIPPLRSIQKSWLRDAMKLKNQFRRSCQNTSKTKDQPKKAKVHGQHDRGGLTRVYCGYVVG